MSMARISLLALCLSLTVSLAAASEPEGSARGDFRFVVGGQVHKINFDVNTDKNGHARGQMSYSGLRDLPDQDVDGTGEGAPAGSLAEFSMTASFDCLHVRGKRASMSGKITGSSAREMIGRVLVLTVEDNGDASDTAPLDRVTWGLYGRTRQNWVPIDSESSEDFGAGLSWIATDAEREDDRGVSTRKNDEIDCRTFAIGGHNLIAVERGGGDIEVLLPVKTESPGETGGATAPPPAPPPPGQ